MSDDYKIEDKSYRLIKFGPNSKWKTVTVSVEEWDKLMTVVEAANSLPSLYEEFKETDVENMSPRRFWGIMQKNIDVFGALKIALRDLEK